MSSWAIIPPIDRPTTTAGADAVARRTAAASSAIARMVSAPGTVRDQPVPRLSTRMTRCPSASGSTNAAGHSRPEAVHPLSNSTVGPAPSSCHHTAGAFGVAARAGWSRRRSASSLRRRRCSTVDVPYSSVLACAASRRWRATSASVSISASIVGGTSTDCDIASA